MVKGRRYVYSGLCVSAGKVSDEANNGQNELSSHDQSIYDDS